MGENITIYDTQAYKYALDVFEGRILAGKYIIKACENFLDDIEKSYNDDNFEWEFRLEILEVIIEFSGMFKFADGIKQGKPIKLAGFQEFILANLFCWKHKVEGYNRYSKAYIQVSRKNARLIWRLAK